mmetsp:Transcript_4297/g.9657  ORF Transcript_4297/g.9657 Transcript_4297/m.9657 type:complete len:203 (+) Transcript_4297:1887-2495(+)
MQKHTDSPSRLSVGGLLFLLCWAMRSLVSAQDVWMEENRGTTSLLPGVSESVSYPNENTYHTCNPMTTSTDRVAPTNLTLRFRYEESSIFSWHFRSCCSAARKFGRMSCTQRSRRRSPGSCRPLVACRRPGIFPSRHSRSAGHREPGRLSHQAFLGEQIFPTFGHHHHGRRLLLHARGQWVVHRPFQSDPQLCILRSYCHPP